MVFSLLCAAVAPIAMQPSATAASRLPERSGPAAEFHAHDGNRDRRDELVPFATIGGIVALFIGGQYLSVPSAIGFIAVFGVAMLNGIMLSSFINELREQGLAVGEAVRRGAELRLRPVLMTASFAILGLIPMLLSTGVEAETQRPLASVVVGGLITSTGLTLLLLPVIYEWIESRKEMRT